MSHSPTVLRASGPVNAGTGALVRGSELPVIDLSLVAGQGDSLAAEIRNAEDAVVELGQREAARAALYANERETLARKYGVEA